MGQVFGALKLQTKLEELLKNDFKIATSTELGELVFYYDCETYHAAVSVNASHDISCVTTFFQLLQLHEPTIERAMAGNYVPLDRILKLFDAYNAIIGTITYVPDNGYFGIQGKDEISISLKEYRWYHSNQHIGNVDYKRVPDHVRSLQDHIVLDLLKMLLVHQNEIIRAFDKANNMWLLDERKLKQPTKVPTQNKPSMVSLPLTLEADYRVLQANEWLKAKKALDGNKFAEADSCSFLCTVLLESWQCCIDYHAQIVKSEVKRTTKFLNFNSFSSPDGKSEHDESSLEKQVEAFFGERMIEHIGSFKDQQLIKSIRSKLERKYSKIFLKDKTVKDYIRKSAQFCLQMVLYQPPLTFIQPRGNYSVDLLKFDLHDGSNPHNNARLQYCLFPCLYQSGKLVSKGSIFVA